MYKRVLCVSALVLSLNSVILADDFDGTNTNTGFNPGIYFGALVGMANFHYSGSYTTPSSSYDSGFNFAARCHLGWAFNPYISAELGYDYYGRPKFKHNDGNTQNILQHGMDLVAKATLPLDYGFGLYVKGGLAWVYRSALHPNNNHFADKSSNSKIAPIGALGVNYWFAPNIALDLCFTKTMTISDLPTTDFFALGITYKINI
ncbi:MAG: outer membrane beta-barrel protein [Coxiellaceae bacterium]|jgi:OOP family OmpA-OmpF porin|nr:outer membrane beta-barrel protein [Coxiellaceae bacterium]